MSTSKIAVRYAKALFLSAKEQDLLDPVRADMELFYEASAGIEDILQLLESPILDARSKSAVLHEIFSSRVNDLSMNFIDLVVRNKREEYLPGMARYYIQLYKEEKGIKVATLSSAVKLEHESKEKLREMIKTAFRSEIELEEEVKKELIGGFVLRVEDKQLDSSVKGKLARIKKELQK
jgi:F-type H+-transporting ATPase subunit delta